MLQSASATFRKDTKTGLFSRQEKPNDVYFDSLLHQPQLL